MPTLQGLNITVSIVRREQQPDDAMGGSVQQFIVIRTGIPARITQMGTPPMLRIQGIENTDNFNTDYQKILEKYLKQGNIFLTWAIMGRTLISSQKAGRKCSIKTPRWFS